MRPQIACGQLAYSITSSARITSFSSFGVFPLLFDPDITQQLDLQR
jgi:hypothetical protein